MAWEIIRGKKLKNDRPYPFGLLWAKIWMIKFRIKILWKEKNNFLFGDLAWGAFWTWYDGKRVRTPWHEISISLWSPCKHIKVKLENLSNLNLYIWQNFHNITVKNPFFLWPFDPKELTNQWIPLVFLWSFGCWYFAQVQARFQELSGFLRKKRTLGYFNQNEFFRRYWSYWKVNQYRQVQLSKFKSFSCATAPKGFLKGALF